MAEMGNYCKAYYAKDFRRFSGWEENLENLRQDADEDGEEKDQRTELEDDDILYLQESYVVTDGIFKDENVIFDGVTDDWKQFCTAELEFEIPEYEPIEIPPQEPASEEAGPPD
ncbi:MAG: hypothetical protein V3T72_00845 [Thermoanaerobaculia bacterium]